MKHIALLSFLILHFLISFSQPCTPNTDTIPGIEPDTLAIAFAGVPYNEAIFYYMPEDTFVLFGTVLVHLYIDSLTIDSVHGLPPGFTYSCNNAWCSVPGGDNGCAAITGTPAAADTGVYPLLVFVTTAVSDTFGTPVAQVPDSVTTYFIEVQMPIGVDEVKNQIFFTGDVYPNPASDVINISVYSEKAKLVVINCRDAMGRIIISEQTKLQVGQQQITLSAQDLCSGIYFIEIVSQQMNLNKKVIKVPNL